MVWIIIHLGMNPVKGGKPPRESNLKGIERAENKLEWLGPIKSEIEDDWREWRKNTTEEEIRE